MAGVNVDFDQTDLKGNDNPPVDDFDDSDNSDIDINTFLEELVLDEGKLHDTIDDGENDIINADQIAGTEEIDLAFETLGDAPFDIDEVQVDQPEQNEQTEQSTFDKEEILASMNARVVKTGSAPVYNPEPEDEIDPRLTGCDMMALIYDEIKRKKFAGHHLDSMNSFNKVGIKQIATKVFADAISSRIKNLRDKTDEDRDITEINFKVEFTDINLNSPTTTQYKSGSVQMLTPGMAKIKNLTYAAQMYIDATITAIATLKNGNTKTRTATIENHRIASVPCEVGTELCNTYNCSKETLKQLEEDPMSPGGFFIIKGFEWTIDNLENITNNTFHVHKNMFMNEICRGNFLSKPGDAFENSYQVILRYLNSGAITIEITTNKFDKFEIPYYIIFRALGMTRDKDIINNIVYGIDNEDPVTKSMLEILERAFDVDDARFGGIRKNTNPTEIIAFIASRITENANTGIARKDDNIAKYLNTNILSIIDRYIFPHIGTGVEHRIKKLRFFGLLINKLLSVFMGVLEPTDRDSYKNKRVFAAGTSMAKTFKTDFNFAIVQEIRKHLIKDFKATPFSQVQLAESVKASINSDVLERMLTQAIVTGNKTITVKRNEITNRISSQILYHKNDLNIKSTLNTINTPNTSASKQNERADEMRRVHPTYLGYIDISQSADTGEKVGTTKQMACTASVCGASSSFILKRILAEDPDILQLDTIVPAQITAEKLAKVFVNGDWIGCCRESHLIARKYRAKRRYGDIHHLTTIVWEPLVREIVFWTDVGRLQRPLVIVYNNIEAYIDNWRHGDRTMKFKQWIKLKREQVDDLRCGRKGMDDLRKLRVIEYISPEESENTYISPNIANLRTSVNDLRKMYTHCDIDQAIFGIVTLAAPMGNHSNAVRNTMYTNHRKQSAGWFALNFPYHIDKNSTFQHYCERPLVSVFSDALTYPNGLNTIVALALHGGRNSEDSVHSNQSSIDCGAYQAACYNYEKAELEKGEQFGNPDYARTMDIKKDATYEYIKGGTIAENTEITKNYVLIVKAAKIPKPTDNFLYVDKSIVYKKDEPVVVERVITTRNDEDALITKVKLRANRPLGVGDKLSCTSGDHEVLTTRGWIPIAEVTLQDEVATLQDGEYLMYTNPTELHSYDHDGDMYVVDSMHIRARTTMNHRMYVANKKGGEYNLVEASEIVGKPRYYKTSAEWLCPDVPTYICQYTHDVVTEKNMELITGGNEWPDLVFQMDDWLEFLGIWISDGNLVKANHCQIQVTAVKERKTEHLFAVLDKMGFKAKSFGKNHYIYSSQIYAMLRPLNVGAGHKFLPNYVWKLSKRQCRILLSSLISGDGCIHSGNGHTVYTTSSSRLADDVMRLITHCGYTGYKQIDKLAGHESPITKDGVTRIIKSNFDSLKVSVNYSCHDPGVNSDSRRKSDHIEKYVGKVYCLSVPGEVFMIRHRGKCWWSGNSRSGNKGICAITVPRCDMPYCEDGLVPDHIVNAHSIPTRMALNQITECVLGQVAAKFGVHIDATCFRDHDFVSAVKLLEQKGVKYGGHRRMYNGMTGNWIDTLIFIGPTCYQRLQKFVVDEHYATRKGPTSASTHQPLDGKNNDGGLKVGEMEKDVFVAHGSMRALHEKFYKDSDGVMIPICRVCENQAIVNEKWGIYKCTTCGDAADIVNVSSSWVANLSFKEFKAMNINTTFELAPHIYSKNQTDI